MEIKCENFSLKIISEKEYEAYYALINNNRERLKPFFPGTLKAVQSLDHAKVHLTNLHQKLKNKIFYPFGIYESEKLIGWISIKNIDWRILKGELGYYIDESSEGKGIISQSVNEVVKFAFDELEMEKIFIRTGPNNLGSQRVAIKNGFIKEGVLRNEFRKESGELIDTIYFGKLKNRSDSKNVK